MTTLEVFHDLQARDIRLTVDGELLRYDAPEGAMTDEIMTLLRQHKAALCALLAQPAHAAATALNTEEACTRQAHVPPPYPGHPVGAPFRPGHQVWLYRWDDQTPRFDAPVTIVEMRTHWPGAQDLGWCDPAGEVSWHNARLAVAVETQEGCAHQEPRQAESSVVSPVLPLDAALEASAAAWRCHCCQGTRRWRSIYGAVVCARCHPPASPALVTGWAGEASPIARWPALSCIGAAQSADTATSWASDASQQRERGRADAGGSQVQRLVGHSCGKWSVP